MSVSYLPLPNKKTYPSLPSNSGDTQDPNDHPVVPPPLREKGDVPLLPPYIDTLPPKVETIIDKYFPPINPIKKINGFTKFYQKAIKD